MDVGKHQLKALLKISIHTFLTEVTIYFRNLCDSPHVLRKRSFIGLQARTRRWATTHCQNSGVVQHKGSDLKKALKSAGLSASFVMAGLSSLHASAADFLELTVENQKFTLVATTVVSYGANDVFTQKTLQPGTSSCSNDFFGDPLRGVSKACFMPNSPQNSQLQRLVGQHSEFTLTKTTVVSYGANNSINQKTLAPGRYVCSDKFFGDTILGIVKSCYAQIDSVSLRQIIGEAGSFELTVPMLVSYGANNIFFKKLLQPGTYLCGNALFNDPLWGVAKACYIGVAAT